MIPPIKLTKRQRKVTDTMTKRQKEMVTELGKIAWSDGHLEGQVVGISSIAKSMIEWASDIYFANNVANDSEAQNLCDLIYGALNKAESNDQ